MPLLALCTWSLNLKVFFDAKKFIEFVFALVRESSPCHFTFFFCVFPPLAMWHNRVFGLRRAWNILKRFLNIAEFSRSSDLVSAFSGYDIIQLDSAWIGDSRSSHCFLLLFNFPGLSMNPSRHFGFGITIVNVFLKDVSFSAPFNLHTYNSLLEFFRMISAWIKVLSNVIFSFSRTSSRLISFPDLTRDLGTRLPRGCTDVVQPRFPSQNQT